MMGQAPPSPGDPGIDQRGFYVYLGLVALSAVLLLGWLTPRGAGVGPTSIVYLAGAKSLLDGTGYVLGEEAITHFPPLYSWFLAVLGLTGMELVAAARWLNAGLLGINVGLVGLLVARATGFQSLAAVSAAALYFLSALPLLILHTMAWSEPLFLALVLTGLGLLTLYVERPSRRSLLGSALFLGLAVVTRYAGFFFLPAAGLVVFAGSRGMPANQRRNHLLGWTLMAITPLVLLMTRNSLLASSATARSLEFHPPPLLGYLRSMINTGLEFVAPISMPRGLRPAIFLVLALALVGLLRMASKRHRQEMDWRSPAMTTVLVCLNFGLVYVGFLLFAVSFFDAAIPPNSRILSPVLVLLILASVVSAWNLARILERPALWRGFLALVALSIAVKIPQTILVLKEIREEGLDFNSRSWRGSEGVAFVASLPEDTRVYTNGTDALEFLTGRNTLPLPEKLSIQAKTANPRYADELTAMCGDLRENGALLVHFSSLDWRRYLPTVAEVEALCPIEELQVFPDSVAYGHGESTPASAPSPLATTTFFTEPFFTEP